MQNKNFIKINDDTLNDSSWEYQGSLLHLILDALTSTSSLVYGVIYYPLFTT